MLSRLATQDPQPQRQALDRLISEVLSAWNVHDVDHAITFYAPDYEGIDVAEAQLQHGPDGMRRTMTRYLEAFPDLLFTEEATLIEGDRIAVIWTVEGTHQGKLMNIPPTGRRIKVWGTSLLTIADGKIARALYVWDVAGLLRGIGLLPDL
jgi:steroid delta-isomerase-like uncharacterized protein